MISINSSTRQFVIPGADLTFGVEADSGSERKDFTCPRYVGNNLDIASCFVRINYRNANGDMDSYLVDDVAVDGDNITFSWELAPKVTAYKGQVKFVMCVVGPDLKVKWHTTQGMGQVYEGLEPDQSHVEDETDDVVAALIAMVEAQTAAVENVGETWVSNVKTEGATQVANIEATAQTAQTAVVAEIEAKGVNTLTTIPEDYAALSEAVDTLTRTTGAAIVCEVEGSAITISDASDNYVQGLRVFGKSTQDGTPTPDAPVEIESVVEPVVSVCGKNLFNLGTFSGTQSSWNNVKFPAGQYTVSAVATSDDTDSTTCLVLIYEDGKKLASKQFTRGVRDSLTFTVNGTLTHILLYAADSNDNGVGDAFQFANIMLELGSMATEYESYKAAQTLELTHTLPGIPVTSGGNYTDSDGQQWICDEVDLERGVYVQRMGLNTMNTVDIYTEYTLSGKTGRGQLIVSPNPPKDQSVYATLCNVAVRNSIALNAVDGEYYENPANIVFVGNIDEVEESMRTKYADFKLLYVLATPIETPLSETEIAAYRALHTNRPNTTILNDSGAHMAGAYAADTKLYIDNKITALIGG